MLAGNPDVELIGSAPNPLLPMEMVRKNPPYVLLLDIKMMGLDGLTFLRQIMSGTPIPTVICSTLSKEGSKVALEALEAGALAVLAKLILRSCCGWATCEPAQTFCGRFVQICSGMRWPRRLGNHLDWYGGRRCAWHEGAA